MDGAYSFAIALLDHSLLIKTLLWVCEHVLKHCLENASKKPSTSAAPVFMILKIKLGKVAKDMGISLTFHHHMGTVVQTAAEIDRLMENTDPELFNLLFDSGHLAYCGEDYMAVLKKYIGRIKHVHLKDIRPEVVAEVKKNGLSFLEGVRMGTFTVPGDGAIDFEPIFKVLEENDYEGYVLVEAEQDPAKANPFEYAVKARKYIREKSGL